MTQFPKWKYWLVILVMLAGMVFALPNVFTYDPALQLARQDRKSMDAAGEQRVRGILTAQDLSVVASYFEGDRLVLRFVDEATQVKARQTIIAATPDYSVALSKASRMPDWLRRTGLKPMSLGLDLRGGVHFLYEVDVDGAIKQSMDRLERDFRTLLRDKRIPYLSVTTLRDSVEIQLRSADDLTAAVAALKKSEDNITITSSNDNARPVIVAKLTPENLKQRQDAAIQQNVTTLRNRIDQLGVSEPIVARQGRDRILVQLPGVSDPNEAIRVLGATATLEIHMVDESNDASIAESTKHIPLGSKLYKMRDTQRPILLKRELIVAGEQLVDANSTVSEGQPAVSVKLDSRGGADMLRNTQQNVGHRMGVVYIEKKRLAEGERCLGVQVGTDCTQEEVISDARINGVFGANFIVTGLGVTEAHELALLLRAGSLAAPVFPVEQRAVGPSLGQGNIDRGVQAMFIGLVLTFAFMAMYYRAFGWVANAVLLANLILTIGLLSMLHVSLSLPGIAAVVFHLGIAVDANILIYERIREELRNGNSPQASINAGFDKAFATIADSNVTTLIAGAVLFSIGSGTIRSFAIVMTLGILTSLFTSVVGSRALVHAIWGRRRRLESLSI